MALPFVCSCRRLVKAKGSALFGWGAEFRCRSLSPLRGRAGETGEVVQGAQFPRAACVFQFVCSAMLRATALKASSILSAHFMPGAVSMPLLRSRPSG